MAPPNDHHLDVGHAVVDLYRDLHERPELGFQEHRTASLAAEHLTRRGFTSGRG